MRELNPNVKQDMNSKESKDFYQPKPEPTAEPEQKNRIAIGRDYVEKSWKSGVSIANKGQKFGKRNSTEIKKAAFYAIATIFLISVFQNFDTVQVESLFWSFGLPKVALMLSMILVGFFGGYLWHRGLKQAN